MRNEGRESGTPPGCLAWASGGTPHKMGEWEAWWEWGVMGVGEDSEFSPEKVKFEVS